MSYPRTVYQLTNQVRFFAKRLSECTSEEMEELLWRGCPAQTAGTYNQLHEKLEMVVDHMADVLKIARQLNLEVK